MSSVIACATERLPCQPGQRVGLCKKKGNIARSPWRVRSKGTQESRLGVCQNPNRFNLMMLPAPKSRIVNANNL